MSTAPTMPLLRAAVVGCGQWARGAIIPGLRGCDGVELIAVADIDRQTSEAAAKANGGLRAYASASELFEAERLDLVAVVTPDDCHLADVSAALAAGCHVFCEKPLAVTVADARVLADAATAAGVKTRMGFTFRFAPAVMRLRELVAGGDLGEPHLLTAFQQNGQFLDPARPFHWKMDGARTGGGAIVEYGVHTLDLARWLLGDVRRVSAASRTLVPERPLPEGGTTRVAVDDSTAWQMEFANGALALCHAGWATIGRPPGLALQVFGSRGTAEVFLSDEAPGDEALLVAGPDGHFRPAELPVRLTAHVPATGPWWQRWPSHLLRRFVAELHGDPHAFGPTFEDGVRAQELLAAVQTAAREERWVTL